MNKTALDKLFMISRRIERWWVIEVEVHVKRRGVWLTHMMVTKPNEGKKREREREVVRWIGVCPCNKGRVGLYKWRIFFFFKIKK